MLDGVLSEVAKTYPDMKIEDMDAYVSRAPAERQKKAQEKKRATPPRPMNSFMLYRHCYSEIIKKFLAGKGNHQQVSYIAGKSWQNEPDELRAKFQEYADLEKESHKLAFPNYHFKPKKDQSSKKRKKAFDDDDDDDEESEWGDANSWGTPVSRSSNLKRQRIVGAPTGHREYQQPTYYDSRLAPPQVPLNRSSFEASNPGRVAPGAYPQLQPGQYLQRTTHPYPLMESVQDVLYTQQELPGHSHHGSSIIAMPGTGQHDLTYQHQPHPNDTQFLDPRLSEWADGGVGGGHYPDHMDNPSLHTGEDLSYHGMPNFCQDQHFQYESDPRSHPGEQTLTDPMEHWSLAGDGLLEGHDNLSGF
jgi:hypothetical protein